MITFDEHYAQVVAEAEAEGPAAVAELRMYETSYRLAGQLIARRRELCMTQQQLAAASGIHQSEISRIESGNGNPTLKTLGALARALDAELRIASS
ncbi:MAG TPA: helix-turn-helix transcriptional regulator [Thermoleophilia bacterium]|nr:helix-turn-helix transcriptional regulator [Thermoleophilia bacterium]